MVGLIIGLLFLIFLLLVFVARLLTSLRFRCVKICMELQCLKENFTSTETSSEGSGTSDFETSSEGSGTSDFGLRTSEGSSAEFARKDREKKEKKLKEERELIGSINLG